MSLLMVSLVCFSWPLPQIYLSIVLHTRRSDVVSLLRSLAGRKDLRSVNAQFAARYCQSEVSP
jgi:hypothetical protein